MNNYYAICPARRRRIGTPSWWAALKYHIYHAFHRAEYAPYERECW